jgi:NADH dehydrogenase FAD-containing subunit
MLADMTYQIPCTGQRPNTEAISGFLPDTISDTTQEIKVAETLQVAGNKTYPNILAFGDVAETGGPKMGRAGVFQAEVVCQNIVSMISGDGPRMKYQPSDVEGAIKLTLGKASFRCFSHSMRGILY